MDTLQQRFTEYKDRKAWLQVQGSSPQVKQFEKRFTKPSVILDIGCGAGHDTLYLRRHGHHVISADLDSPVADVACDVADMPFTSELFDGVFCRGVLHLCSNFDEGIREIIRVSKDGAFIFISYPLDMRVARESLPLGKMIRRNGKVEILYEQKSLKNHIDHKHTFYMAILRKRCPQTIKDSS